MMLFCLKVDKIKYLQVIDLLLGNIKDESRGLLKLKYPISHGIVNDWKSMDLIWKYIFQELKVNPKECPVFITEPPLNPFE